MSSRPNDASASSSRHQHHGQSHERTRIMDESEEELTEDEREAYEDGILTWEKMSKPSFWIRKEWIWYYIGIVVVMAVGLVLSHFHEQIISYLTPYAKKLRRTPQGWTIPVAVLVILSFPPLFGNEVIMLLVGIVWGLNAGFEITVAGTLIGEIANYFVFKYWCSGRAERMTKKSLNYACLTQVVKDGGFWMATLIRLSAIPTHFSTVLFAVCGLPLWQFNLAMIAGLPKQLIAVYAGVIIAGTKRGKTPSKAVNNIVFIVTIFITFASLYYIYREMIAVRKKVLIGMRKDLAGKGVTGVDDIPGERGGAGGNQRGRGQYGADGRGA